MEEGLGLPHEGVGGGEGSGGLLGLEGLGPQMVKFMPNELNFLSEDWGPGYCKHWSVCIFSHFIDESKFRG